MNYARLASRVDATAGKIEQAVAMNQVGPVFVLIRCATLSQLGLGNWSNHEDHHQIGSNSERHELHGGALPTAVHHCWHSAYKPRGRWRWEWRSSLKCLKIWKSGMQSLQSRGMVL